jgi:hypothetical protein
VLWQVKAGFTLKKHAPLAGPCHEKFSYPQDWDLRNDEPTADLLTQRMQVHEKTAWMLRSLLDR